MRFSAAAPLSVLVLVLGCSKASGSDDGHTTTTQGATESGEPGDTSTTEVSETDETDEVETDETETDEGVGFVPDSDLFGCSISELSVCDEIAQDCPEGEKCVPFVVEDCSFPKCIPVTGEQMAGEPCTVDAMGADDCDADSWCYPGSLDPELPTVCIAFCQGTVDNSHCDDPSQICMSDRLHYDGTLGCRPSCDPLMPEGCAPFERCTLEPHISPSLFGCVIGGGVADGEVCSGYQQCDSGECMAAEQLLGCEGAACCAPWCDLMAPDCAIGLECVPVEVDDPNSTVGVCALPDP